MNAANANRITLTKIGGFSRVLLWKKMEVSNKTDKRIAATGVIHKADPSMPGRMIPIAPANAQMAIP
jgi:hypothetical protein